MDDIDTNSELYKKMYSPYKNFIRILQISGDSLAFIETRYSDESNTEERYLTIPCERSYSKSEWAYRFETIAFLDGEFKEDSVRVYNTKDFYRLIEKQKIFIVARIDIFNDEYKRLNRLK